MTTSKADGAKGAGKKILERIRKLLRMAGDVGSPNEAAIAARRAKHIMTEYNLSHADMLVAHLNLDSMECHPYGPSYKAYPLYLSMLAVGVAEYTDCRARFDWKPGQGGLLKCIYFEGEASDLEICKYLWDYLHSTVDRLCKQSGVMYIGPRTRFKKACVSAIKKTLSDMKAADSKADAVTSDGKSLVLLDRKKLLLDEKYGVVKYSRNTYVFDAAAQAGREAGRGVAIRKAVNTSTNTRRLK